MSIVSKVEKIQRIRIKNMQCHSPGIEVPRLNIKVQLLPPSGGECQVLGHDTHSAQGSASSSPLQGNPLLKCGKKCGWKQRGIKEQLGIKEQSLMNVGEKEWKTSGKSNQTVGLKFELCAFL